MSKSELILALGLPRSTITNWILFFSAFIPFVRQGNVICYGPEALPALKKIKHMRQQKYSRSTIFNALAVDGYPTFTNSYLNVNNHKKSVPTSRLEEVSQLEQLILELKQESEKIAMIISRMENMIKQFPP